MSLLSVSTPFSGVFHHEQTQSSQKSFFEKVKSLSAVMQEMGIPFQEESADLMVLDTKNIADPTLAEVVATQNRRGKEQSQSFMEGLKDEDESPFYPPIKKNLVSFFKQEQVEGISKEKVLKDDCQIFSRLFILCQKRQYDLQKLFKHENQSHPASLSDSGKLHTCQKSHLVDIIEEQVKFPDREPKGNAIIIDGSALINALPPCTSETFDDYAKEDIIPKVEHYVARYERMNVVFDVYKKSSLKSETRS